MTSDSERIGYLYEINCSGDTTGETAKSLPGCKAVLSYMKECRLSYQVIGSLDK